MWHRNILWKSYSHHGLSKNLTLARIVENSDFYANQAIKQPVTWIAILIDRLHLEGDWHWLLTRIEFSL